MDRHRSMARGLGTAVLEDRKQEACAQKSILKPEQLLMEQQGSHLLDKNYRRLLLYK